MNRFTKEDYLRMLHEAAQEQYGSEDGDYVEPLPQIDESAWIPAIDPRKEQMLERLRRSTMYGRIDAAKLRKEQIQDALYKCVNLEVGGFILHVNEYHGHPTPKKGKELTLDISILSRQNRTATGAPCSMDLPANLHKDDRFQKRPWLHLFDVKGRAYEVPMETVVDIVRWLQALKRMNAFL